MNEFYFTIAKKYQQYWVKHIISMIKSSAISNEVDRASLQNSYLENWLADFRENIKSSKFKKDILYNYNTIATYNLLFNNLAARLASGKAVHTNDYLQHECKNLIDISSAIVESIDYLQSKIIKSGKN